jgi:DeoR family transcriptional regulator, suf operon transcriptional repressor
MSLAIPTSSSPAERNDRDKAVTGSTGMATARTEIPAVSERQREVLYALKRRGEATIEELADSLDMTPSGARQHLLALLEVGLVAVREEPRPAGQRGRPMHRYAPTSAAEDLFPKAYGELTNELLGYLDEHDSTVIDKIFARRRDERIANATRRLAGKDTLAKKVAELTRILDADGYLATWEKLSGGAFRIIEHNCAIFAVAQRYGSACSSELAFIRTVLPDATVERVSHMVQGARHCAYEITPTTPPLRRS